jgi:secreted Zn-dependent insulinase-like peptidase
MTEGFKYIGAITADMVDELTRVRMARYFAESLDQYTRMKLVEMIVATATEEEAGQIIDWCTARLDDLAPLDQQRLSPEDGGGPE